MKPHAWVTEAILPLLLAAYFLMYLTGIGEDMQWYVYFVSRQSEIMILSLLVHSYYKSATTLSVCLISGYELVAEVMGTNEKGSIFEIIFTIIIIFAIIKPYIKKWNR